MKNYINNELARKILIFLASSDMFLRLNVNSRIQVLDTFYRLMLDIIADYLLKKYGFTILNILEDYDL